MATRPTHLEIDVSPAYELLMSLSAVSQPELYRTYEVGRDWFEQVRRQSSAQLLDAIQYLTAGCDKVLVHLVSLAYECPAPRDVPRFVAYLEGVDAFQIYLHLLGYHMRYFRRATPAEIIRAAAGGDLTAQRKLLKTSYPGDVPWQAALHRLLSVGAAAVKEQLLYILRSWYAEVFRGQESQVMTILERDAETKRALQQDMSPEQVIEIATNGVEYAPEPGITRVLLIPCYVIRPWVHTIDYQDLKIFCYPVADESVSADRNAPPARLVRLTKALGDERRLQALKLLATGPYTLQDVADHFGVAKTTMHHHLVILRSAGLVRMRSSDRKYSLRREIIPDVSELLDEYLKGEGS
jgi:DNA-binding transcriptional ArsR family regulator